MKPLALLILLFILKPQAQPTWIGTWDLNLEKSTGPTRDQFRRITIRIEPWQDGLKVTYDTVGIRGGVTHMEWAGKFDGKDYPVRGLDYVLTNAYTARSDREYSIVVKIDGLMAATTDVAISPDGKTLTTSTIENNPQGQSFTTTTVYDRRK